MKKRISRITILLFLVAAVVYTNKGFDKLITSQTVEAFGDLIVDFHVEPIFNLINMKPTDVESRPIDVQNNGSVPRFIATRGIHMGGVGTDPKIETALLVRIKDGATPIYGPVTMADFFSQSMAEDGIPLNIINAGESKTYNFFVEFPASAGDTYQSKSVQTDIKFGTIVADDLVINEVLYNPKTKHWFDYLIDRFDTDNWEDRYTKNDKKRLFRRQWIELYNPTDQDISLKNWSLTDNSGKKVVIHVNKKINADGFALVSKSAFIWWFHRHEGRAVKVEIGRSYGDGLDLAGDRLILKNPSGAEVDRISWGSDVSAFDPSIPIVDQGHSSERIAPGFDNDTAADWKDQFPPTPGH